MQKIIFREDNKSFNKINDITLFEGEENADYLEILVPQKYNNIDLSDCNIRLTYITSDNHENTFLINEYKQDILYKDNFLYLINIDERFTSVVGKIQMYLTFSKSDEKDILFKSGVATMFIKDHPSGNNELTEKELDIIDQVVLISNKALKTAESVEQRADSGEFDGFSPTAVVTKEDNGVTITIEDRNGTTSEKVLNGEKGFSPTVETEKVENKTKISITNETSVSETYISDGVVPVYDEKSDYVVFKNAQQLEADGLISAILGGES